MKEGVQICLIMIRKQTQFSPQHYEKTKIIMGIKNRMFGEGLLMETQTFDQWIKHIKNM